MKNKYLKDVILALSILTLIFLICYFKPVKTFLYHKSTSKVVTVLKDTTKQSDTLTFIKGDMKYTIILTPKKHK